MGKYSHSIVFGLVLVLSALPALAQGPNPDSPPGDSKASTENTYSSIKVYGTGGDTGVGVEAKVNVNATSSAKDTNEVSAVASEIRGWDTKSKQDFLATVKAQAQLKSGQDLQNFAKGVMLKDTNVDAVVAGDNSVEVHYKLPAKFLGVFGTDLDAITNVTFETSKTGRGPKTVTVKFPWYKIFFSLSADVREEVLQSAIAASVNVGAQVPRDNAYSQNGVTINIISEVLKAVRTKIEAQATTTTSI